jgi:hypothetical protein
MFDKHGASGVGSIPVSMSLIVVLTNFCCSSIFVLMAGWVPENLLVDNLLTCFSEGHGFGPSQ